MAEETLKFLFINPPHWQLTGIHNNQNAGLGLLYLASMIPTDVPRCILDAEVLKYNWYDLKSFVREYKPSDVFVTATTLSFKAMVYTCKQIRNDNCDINIIIGGPHVTAQPHKSLALTGADIACVGEGEYFIQNYYNDRVEIGESNRLMGDVHYGTPFKEIDKELPRNIYYPPLNDPECYAGNDPVYGRPETCVMWQRGCGHNCNFCSTKAVFGHTIRKRSVDSIIKELQVLKKHNIKGVFIYDDELVGGYAGQNEWLTEICEAIITNKLNDLDYKSQGRCSKELLDLDVLKLMKKAGFKGLMMGCESGSQKVLNTIRKGIKVEDIKHSIKLIKQSGIETFCYWMIGNKGETADDAELTYLLMKDLKPYMDHKHVTILNPLVGSDIYTEAMNNGWIVNHDLNSWTQHHNPVMMGEWMNCMEIKEWERKLLEI